MHGKAGSEAVPTRPDDPVGVVGVVGQPGRRRTVLLAVPCIAYVVSVLVRSGRFSAVADGAAYQIGLMTAIGLCVRNRTRASTPIERLQWTAFGLGSTLFGVGMVLWNIFLRPQGAAAPFPSISDYLWFASYGALGFGMVCFLRGSGVSFQASVVLDAVTCALAVGSLAAGLAFGQIVDANSSGASVATNISYPVLDLMLLLLAVTTLGLRRWRFDTRTTLLGLAFVIFAATDTIYLLRVADHTFEPGTILDTGWLIALTLIGISGRFAHVVAKPSKGHSWGLLVTPIVAGIGSGALLVYGSFRHLTPLAVGLAAASLAVAAARMMVTFKEVRALSAVRDEARTDDLTGVGNRRRLTDELEAVATSSTFAVLAIDLDRFKDVNDTFGHSAGDELLQVVATRIAAVLRAEDLLTRVGGDEFTVVLDGADTDAAIGAANRILTSMRTPFVLSFGTVAIDASIGVAVAPEHAVTGTALLRHADEAMYVAKRDGTGVELYRVAVGAPNQAEKRLLQQLRDRGIEGQLVLYFQPKMDLRTGSVWGAEALVRWNHPERGILPPNEFLPLCEGTGLMRRITQWIVDGALAQTRSWLDAGHRIPVAINISATDLDDTALPEFAASALARHRLPGDLVTFEITETSLIGNPKRAAEVIRRLRALGVDVSLDDFGTGFSSLSHLTTFDLSELKLDRYIVTGLNDNAASEIVVRSLTDMAHALGLRVVAEGIEDPSLAERLRDIGCDLGQGFLWSRAIPADEFVRFVESVQADSGLVDAASPR